jgi:hypothetical protein
MTPRHAEFVIHLEDAPPWKREDREWFAAHPDRTHRVRDIFGWATFDLLSEAAAQGRTVVPPAAIGVRILSLIRGGTA